MTAARYADAAALLPGGRVLVAGGWSLTTNDDPSLASAEIYDPATNAWTVTGSLGDARGSLTMAGLPDGRVIAIAGVDPAYHVLAARRSTTRYSERGRGRAVYRWPWSGRRWESCPMAACSWRVGPSTRLRDT
jgi:hypothetical protein